MYRTSQCASFFLMKDRTLIRIGDTLNVQLMLNGLVGGPLFWSVSRWAELQQGGGRVFKIDMLGFE